MAALLSSAIFLSVVLTWLIEWGGVISCGKGIFDSPDWPLQVSVLVGPPVVLMFGVGALFVWCSERIRLKKMQPKTDEDFT